MNFDRAVVLSLLAGGLVAQVPSHVSPTYATVTLGKSHNTFPFAERPNLCQQIHDAATISGPAPATFQKLRLRMAYEHLNENGATVDTEFYLGECPTTAALASETFALNIVPGTETNVFTRKPVVLPKVATYDWAIAPFPFDAPWVWQGRHVEWRTIVHGNSNGNLPIAYGMDAWTEATAAQLLYDSGCKGPGALWDAALLPVLLSPGSNEVFRIDSKVAALQPAVLNFGTSRNQWGNLMLPFDLGPLGAPTCYIRAEGLASLNSATDATGVAPFAIQVPNQLELQGGTFYMQGLVLNAGANPLGLYTTQGVQSTIGIRPIGLARIWTTTMPPPPQGTKQNGAGLAVAFN